MPHECFADEIAIDFPSVGHVVERMRDAFLGEDVDADIICAEVLLSRREASDGLVVSIEVPDSRHVPRLRRPRRNVDRAVRRLQRDGRVGLPCIRCESSVPRGVADGARFRFRVTSPDAASRRASKSASPFDRRQPSPEPLCPDSP